MSFMLYREEKKEELQLVPDGQYTAEVTAVEADPSNNKACYVSFTLLTGKTIRNRYVFNPKKRDALDILVNVALGSASINIDLEDIIGKFVKITVVNEDIYTNVKKVNRLNQKDIENLERHLNDEDTNDLDSSDDEEREELDEEVEDDELDLESWEDSEVEDTDEIEDEDAEEPQSTSSDYGRRRRRFS